MGNYGAWLWLSLLGSKGRAGSQEEQGSGHQCSQPLQGWNLVNKNLFLSTLMVGSHTKLPREWARLFG